MITWFSSDGNRSNKKRGSATRFQVPSSIGANATSIRLPAPVVHSSDESKSDAEYSLNENDYETSINCGNILFVYLDLHSQLSSHLITLIRAINHYFQTYTDLSTCLDSIRSSHDRIFFISSSTDKQLIEEFHNLNSVEAIFIVNSEAQIDSRFPKLYGAYTHSEELLMALRETLDWFEETQMELFVFQRDRIFIWSQLWKEEFIKPKKSKASSNKEKLIQVAENYYQGNIKVHQSISDFDQFYNTNDALQWCLSAPFPSYFLRHALRSHNNEHLHACRYLLNDMSRIIQQQSGRRSSCELYKGMKMTNEYLDKLENHFGELICPKGFLLCSQSRKTALEIASSPNHRPDLIPVLFKITYDRSVPIAELPKKNAAPLMVFDIFTVFRVKYVNRGPVSIVKLEPADEDGRRLGREYRMKYESESVQDLLEQLLSPPKPPARLPPLQLSLIQPPSTPDLPQIPPPTSSDLSPDEVSLSMMPEVDDAEMLARDLVKRGEIDQAIEIYQRLEPNPRILSAIGSVYAEKKNDYDSAINYYKEALKLQDEKGEDFTDALLQIGNIYQIRRDFAMALSYYSRALNKRKEASNTDQVSIATCLVGMANAYWGERNLTEALDHAEQALAINESIESGNELNIGINVGILANIHYHRGDTGKALEFIKKTYAILEPCVPSDSVTLATLINNMATIQAANGLFTDARDNFEKAVELCRQCLPEEHPTRVSMENNIRRIIEIQKKKEAKKKGNVNSES